MTALSQPHEALQLANETRTQNAKLCNAIRDLPTGFAIEAVAALLEQPHGCPGAIPIDRLLLTIPMLGPTRATRLLIEQRIYRQQRPIRDLTPRQREQIIEALRDGSWRRVL